MPNINIRPEYAGEHLKAMRLKGFHKGNFDHNCSADTCTRAAHWRYYPEANPRLAEVLIVCGAYEIYHTADDSGHAHGDSRYAVLERADGPSGSLYVGSRVFDDFAEAMRYTCEMAIENIRAEVGADRLPRPAPVPGIRYREGDTEYELVGERLMKRLPLASGWTPA